MNTVCEVCGDVGYRQLQLCCRDCKRCAVHHNIFLSTFDKPRCHHRGYCLDKVVYDASLIEWFCYECLQRRGEVTCVSSLEKVSCERPLSHAHSRSPVHQLITKSVESVRDAGPWRNRKNESFATKYTSLNRIYSSIKKHTKKKSSMKPMGNCTNREVRIAKVTTHASGEASRSCETIGTELATSNHGKKQQVNHETPIALNTALQPCPLIVNSLGTLGDNHQSHLLETTEGLTCKLKKVPQSLTAPFKGLEKRDNVVLGSNNLGSSCSTVALESLALGKSGDKLNTMKDSGANLSSKHTDHDNQANQHTSVGCKNMEGKSVKDKKTVVDAHKNTFWTVDSLRNDKDKSEAHGDSNRDILNGFTPERDKEEVTLQLDHRASNELLPRSMATDVPQLLTLQNDGVDTVMPYSPNDGSEELFNCPGIKNIPSVGQRSVDPSNISSSSHDTIEASESSERFTECQKASSCSCRKTVKMSVASSSSEESGEDTISENASLEYILACRSYLSKAQEKRVMKLIREIQPEFTIFISIMRRNNVQPPGPFLGITKEYAIAYFPDKTTNVTLETPGKSKKWHPKFYKRDESRKNMLMGRWLDFVRDNHVQEGDICLLLPTKDEIRYTFMIYVLHETTYSRGGAGLQRVGPCPGSSSVKMASECQKASSCRRGEKTVKTGDDILSEKVFLEYVLAYRCYLSKAQKKRVMELIQEIQPEFTIFISIMRRGNVQPPGPFLGITRDYASAHFPDKSTNVTLEMPGKNKKWHPKFYRRDESRNYMLIGQWLDFVRDNHVQEGDICLLVPTKDEIRYNFMIYVLHETTHSRGVAGFQRVAPCPGSSSVKTASEFHIEEEPTAGEHVSSESEMQEISHEPLESDDSDDPFEPPYFVPCRNPLSRSQKRIVEERVRAILSEVPICVAVMKNNNIGVAQRWMLELCSGYGSVYLPTKGQTILLQCEGKTWEAKMMFHNGRRWFINGGWPNFARGNGLRVGDVCLFELKQKESKLTMAVHIIRKEQF